MAMKDQDAISGAEQQQRYRDRLKESGGRMVTVGLSAKAVQAIKKLQSQFPGMSQTELINEAIVYLSQR